MTGWEWWLIGEATGVVTIVLLEVGTIVLAGPRLARMAMRRAMGGTLPK